MAPRPTLSMLSRSLMNLFIGMCKGAAGVPRDFVTLGYSDKWVELRFQNSDGQTVVPELIVSSRRVGHTILFEWKSGANTESDQMSRYAAVTSADLRERAVLAAEETASFDVALVGLTDFAERLAIGIDANHYPFPLLVVKDEGIETFRNSFSEAQTDRVFRPRLIVDWEQVPTYFFPVDGDSELWEFAELIIPRVLELMGKGESRILLPHLEEAIPSWHVIARQFQGALRVKIHEVMRRACQGEFEPYIRANRETSARGRLGPTGIY